MLNARLIAITFGIVFTLIGLAGFIDNPTIIQTRLWPTNSTLCLVHLLTAALFFWGVFKYKNYEKLVILFTGYFYMVVVIIGLIWPDGWLLDFIQIKGDERWLCLGLAMTIITTCILATEQNTGQNKTA
ncbi:MAG: DUF4383 domain-containing protein [Methylococcaceae bacterium]